MVIPIILHSVKLGGIRFFVLVFNICFKELYRLQLFWDDQVLYFAILFIKRCLVSPLKTKYFW